MELILAFVTGLTTGGLSCLAVQGGLLASSLAGQLEADLAAARTSSHPRLARPILLFLLAKLVAYTLLGLMLGALGSMLQLNAVTRAVLLLAVGVFMIGNALRMLNVHPIFRFFTFEPPARLTRFIRRTARSTPSDVGALFLGALTIFIPCGVTQTMMAAALGAGDALMGAALMAAFTLGTSPVFFAVAYFTTRLGARLEKHFMRAVAVVVLILGFVTIDSGLNLIGSPLSFANLTRSLSGEAAIQPQGGEQSPSNPTALNTYQINVKNLGYEPKVLKAAADVPIKLNLVTKNTTSCSLAIVFPSLGIEKLLPGTGTVTIDVPPQPKGSVMRYACSMGMYTAQIVFE